MHHCSKDRGPSRAPGTLLAREDAVVRRWKRPAVSFSLVFLRPPDLLQPVPMVTSSGECRAGQPFFCCDSHRMHSSQSRQDGTGCSNSSSPASRSNWPGPTGPNSHFLKAAAADNLCLPFHYGDGLGPAVFTTAHTRAPRSLGSVCAVSGNTHSCIAAWPRVGGMEATWNPVGSVWRIAQDLAEMR